MLLTRAALTKVNATTYTNYNLTVFNVTQLPAWSNADSCLNCQVGNLMYVVQYRAVVGDPSFTYTSFILDLGDDRWFLLELICDVVLILHIYSDPVYRNWTISGTPPPVPLGAGDQHQIRLSCTDSNFYGWNGNSEELWAIQLNQTPTSTSNTAIYSTSTSLTSTITSTFLPSSNSGAKTQTATTTASVTPDTPGLASISTTALIAVISGSVGGILLLAGILTALLKYRSRRNKLLEEVLRSNNLATMTKKQLNTYISGLTEVMSRPSQEYTSMEPHSLESQLVNLPFVTKTEAAL